MQNNLQFDDAIASLKNEMNNDTGKLKIALVIGLTVAVIAIFKIRIWKPKKTYKRARNRSRRYYRRYRKKRR